jgi:hypothetical protein
MGRIRISRTINLLGKSGVPILLSRGVHPYSGILVPARRTVSGEAAGRAAIDLARKLGTNLVGISAVPAAFVSGPEAVEEARVAAAWLREEAAVQGVHVQRRIRRGNPVRVIEDLADEKSLLVLSMPDLPMAPWRLGITGHLIHRVAGSVLLVPGRS